MKSQFVKDIQEIIAKKYETDVLHILNGGCMLEKFEKNNWCIEKHTYTSFNEAMCWGESAADIFSDDFVEKRVKSLNSTVEQYREIVLNPLKPLFQNNFNAIVLWFGEDMFCQINMLTILAFLEQINFGGEVLFYMVIEHTEDIMPNAFEINIKGSLQRYKKIVCNSKMPEENLMPVMQEAVERYLTYRDKDSEISTFIIENINEEENILIGNLLRNFQEYGLCDLQYRMLIMDIKDSMGD